MHPGHLKLLFICKQKQWGRKEHTVKESGFIVWHNKASSSGIIRLFTSHLQQSRVLFQPQSLDTYSHDTILQLIIFLLEVACNVNKIYSSAAARGLALRVAT